MTGKRALNSVVADTVTGGTPYYSSWVSTFRFAEGDAAGNLAEVGVGWASKTTGIIRSITQQSSV